MFTAILLPIVALSAADTWSLKVDADPITDQKTVTLMLKGDGQALSITCSPTDRANPMVMLISERYLGGRGGSPSMREITFRFDKKPPVTEGWGYTSNYAMSMNPEPMFVDYLATSSQLVIRATDTSLMPIDYKFSLSGGSAEIAKFKADCRKIGVGF